jgi:CRISPR-associated protein Csx10
MANIAIRVTITLEAPLLITARQIGFVWESESFIPGSVLRGSVAQILLANCILNEEERRAPETVLDHQGKCDFHRIFYADQPPRFGHAYPGLEPPIGVLPQTAHTCKRNGGFRRDDADDERHGVFDTLIRQFQSEKNGRPLIPRCPLCDSQKAEPIIGRVYVKRGDRYVSPKALHRRLARTAVGRERGAVAEGLLYTIEALSEQMDRDELDRNGDSYPPALSTFHSVVWVEEANVKKLMDVLHQVYHIGAAISRGMGQVKIETSRSAMPVPTDERMDQAAKALSKGIEPKPLALRLPKEADWLERLLAFNSVWADEQKSAIDGWYFTLDLQSDMLIFRDGPSYELNPDQLGLQGKAELIRAFATCRQIGGWSSAWLMPKPIAPAIAAGSVFLYHVPGGDLDLARIVLKRLAVLEHEGVGQRREEGYGWLQVCTPFHLEIEVR